MDQRNFFNDLGAPCYHSNPMVDWNAIQSDDRSLFPTFPSNSSFLDDSLPPDLRGIRLQNLDDEFPLSSSIFSNWDEPSSALSASADLPINPADSYPFDQMSFNSSAGSDYLYDGSSTPDRIDEEVDDLFLNREFNFTNGDFNYDSDKSIVNSTSCFVDQRSSVDNYNRSPRRDHFEESSVFPRLESDYQFVALPKTRTTLTLIQQEQSLTASGKPRKRRPKTSLLNMTEEERKAHERNINRPAQARYRSKKAQQQQDLLLQLERETVRHEDLQAQLQQITSRTERLKMISERINFPL